MNCVASSTIREKFHRKQIHRAGVCLQLKETMIEEEKKTIYWLSLRLFTSYYKCVQSSYTCCITRAQMKGIAYWLIKVWCHLQIEPLNITTDFVLNHEMLFMSHWNLIIAFNSRKAVCTVRWVNVDNEFCEKVIFSGILKVYLIRFKPPRVWHTRWSVCGVTKNKWKRDKIIQCSVYGKRGKNLIRKQSIIFLRHRVSIWTFLLRRGWAIRCFGDGSGRQSSKGRTGRKLRWQNVRWLQTKSLLTLLGVYLIKRMKI